MFLRITLSLVAMLLTIKSKASEMGPSSGGGGFVIQCQPNALEPKGYTELIDLYRGRRMGLEMPQPLGSIEDNYFRAVKRTYTLQGHPQFADDAHKQNIIENLKGFFRMTRFVLASELPVINDYGDVFVPSQCKVRQLAYFNDLTDEVFIDQELWNQLDRENQAALAHHELFYKHLRSFYGLKSSVQTSLFVAHIYSSSEVPALSEGLPSHAQEAQIISSDSLNPNSSYSSAFLSVYTYGSPSDTLRLQFSQAAGFPFVTKTWGDLYYGEKLTFKLISSPKEKFYKSHVLSTPNVDDEVDVDLHGTQVLGLKYKVRLKTNEPMVMQLYENNTPIGPSGYLDIR